MRDWAAQGPGSESPFERPRGDRRDARLSRAPGSRARMRLPRDRDGVGLSGQVPEQRLDQRRMSAGIILRRDEMRAARLRRFDAGSADSTRSAATAPEIEEIRCQGERDLVIVRGFAIGVPLPLRRGRESGEVRRCRIGDGNESRLDPRRLQVAWHFSPTRHRRRREGGDRTRLNSRARAVRRSASGGRGRAARAEKTARGGATTT